MKAFSGFKVLFYKEDFVSICKWGTEPLFPFVPHVLNNVAFFSKGLGEVSRDVGNKTPAFIQSNTKTNGMFTDRLAGLSPSVSPLSSF